MSDSRLKEQSVKEVTINDESMEQLPDPEFEQIDTEPSVDMIESAKVPQESFMAVMVTEQSNEII